MSQTVVVSEETKYLYKLRETTKKYVSAIIEERILISKARAETREERKKRRDLLKKVREAINNEEYQSLKPLYSEIGKLNKVIAEKEKPFREKAKPFREARKEAFVELVKEMVFHGDLRLDKVIEAGLLKLK